MDWKPLQDFLDFFGRLPPSVASGLIGWTIAVFVFSAVIGAFRKSWSITPQAFAWPIIVFGLAWAARWWVENGLWFFDWVQVIFVLASPTALIWAVINLGRLLFVKQGA